MTIYQALADDLSRRWKEGSLTDEQLEAELRAAGLNFADYEQLKEQISNKDPFFPKVATNPAQQDEYLKQTYWAARIRDRESGRTNETDVFWEFFAPDASPEMKQWLQETDPEGFKKIPTDAGE